MPRETDAFTVFLSSANGPLRVSVPSVQPHFFYFKCWRRKVCLCIAICLFVGWLTVTYCTEAERVSEWAWFQLHFIYVCATDWNKIINFTLLCPLGRLELVWFVSDMVCWSYFLAYSWFCHSTVWCFSPVFLQPEIFKATLQYFLWQLQKQYL